MRRGWRVRGWLARGSGPHQAHHKAGSLLDLALVSSCLVVTGRHWDTGQLDPPSHPQVAVYCDEHGKQHAYSAICPHMGCLLHVSWRLGAAAHDGLIGWLLGEQLPLASLQAGGTTAAQPGSQLGGTRPSRATHCILVWVPVLVSTNNLACPCFRPTTWRRRLTAPATAPTSIATARSSTVSPTLC